MIDLDAFRAARPEFAKAPDALVTAELANAANRIDPDRYLDKTDEAHSLLTAHLLAQSPFGAFARLDPKSIKAYGASTTYEREFLKLQDMAACLVRTFPEL